MAAVSAAAGAAADSSLYQSARRFYRRYRASLPVRLPRCCRYGEPERPFLTERSSSRPPGLNEGGASEPWKERNPGGGKKHPIVSVWLLASVSYADGGLDGSKAPPDAQQDQSSQTQQQQQQRRQA